ncbi:MAG TPA: hypothetical protein VHM01_21130 [Alphaproteobacteria bacterium]|nr:hypothetical protein [Alphaproteobacteria bacterium]
MIKRLAALAIPLLALAAAPAKADGWKHKHHGHHWHGHHHHHKHHWHGHRHGSASIVFWSGPVYRPYYPPPRVVYAPPPVVYAPAPAPVVYAPAVNAVPTGDFRDAEGRYCREYQRTATIDGREQQIYGTACLMPDGAWRIVSE